MRIRVTLIAYLLMWIMQVKNMTDFSLQRIRHILKTTLSLTISFFKIFFYWLRLT